MIKQLQLHNFRNYKKLMMEFHPNLNIIIGNNGAGKTNILESLIMVSNTKSFRTLNDQNLILKDTEYSRIDAYGDKNRFKVIINEVGKSLFIDQNNIKRSSDFIGKMNCVLFKPSDLEIFDQSPKERRKLLDLEIGKVDHEYLNAALSFNKLLKDKNNLLKQDSINQTYLEIIEESMIEPIKILISKRMEFIDFINQEISKIYKELSSFDVNLKVQYKKCSNPNTEAIKEMISKSKERDLNYHYTTSGPHKDDLEFKMNEEDVVIFASQGQKRMILIAFKFALVKYIEYKTNQKPIILLDDILSELDLHNRKRLLHMIPSDTQTIITTTDTEGIVLKRSHRIFQIKEGEIYDIYNY